MRAALQNMYAASLRQTPDEWAPPKPEDNPFDAAFRRALDGSHPPADTAGLAQQFAELSSDNGTAPARSLPAPSAPLSPRQMDSRSPTRARSPSPAHWMQQQWQQQQGGPSSVGGLSIRTKRPLPGQALSATEQTALRNQFLYDLHSQFGPHALAAFTIDDITTDIDNAFSTPEEKKALKNQLDAWLTVREEYLAKHPEMPPTRTLFITSNGKALLTCDVNKIISRKSNVQAKTRASGALSNTQLAPRNDLGAMLESIGSYTHKTMVKLTFTALDATIARLSEPNHSTVRKARDAWHAVWQNIPEREGKKPDYVFMTGDGQTMLSSAIKSAITTARNKKTKLRLRANQSKSQLAPRNALAEMVESVISYTPRSKKPFPQ